jgi:transcriptional antiterminator NusG
VPLDRDDTELLNHFLSFGDVVGPSVVYFDEQKRIRVVSGPLRGMEGRIVKVDKRKGRARVKLDLYNESFQIDFGFQALEAVPEPTPR